MSLSLFVLSNRLNSSLITCSDARSYLTIHTGNWGCGAFGGSKPLMALLQCLAAQSAGKNREFLANKNSKESINSFIILSIKKAAKVMNEEYKS
jgi:hypothetical protein